MIEEERADPENIKACRSGGRPKRRACRLVHAAAGRWLNLLVVIKGIRSAAKIANEHDDRGTVDLLSKIVQIHEKHEWWMRDILRSGDGLCA